MSDQLFDLTDDGDGSGPRTGATAAARESGAIPLAARMRPRTLDDYVGQAEVVATGTPLRTLLESGDLPSLILWGPPGSGKTSLATVVAGTVTGQWRELSAVTAGVKDVRAIIDEGRTRLESAGRRTVLFVDEIHRFNKGQQDALLPGVENGWVTLIGATTENPFFELNAPLLSRARLVQLSPLTADDLLEILARACRDPERGYGGRVALDDEAAAAIAHLADGDARAALNTLETAVAAAGGIGGATDADPVTVAADEVAEAVRRYRYDKAGDGHYDQVSAFIKSLRGSDPDAAVYWLLRMLEEGEDPRFLARRMVILASEDIGLAADTLPLAVAAFEALDRVGLPEARFALTHVAIALAVAPKSNAVTRAIGAGLAAVRDGGNAPVPAHLRDAHYRGAAAIGHGVDYDYPHDHPGGIVAQRYLPDELADRRIYEPTTNGDEAAVAERLRDIRGRTSRGGHDQHDHDQHDQHDQDQHDQDQHDQQDDTGGTTRRRQT